MGAIVKNKESMLLNEQVLQRLGKPAFDTMSRSTMVSPSPNTTAQCPPPRTAKFANLLITLFTTTAMIQGNSEVSSVAGVMLPSVDLVTISKDFSSLFNI